MSKRYSNEEIPDLKGKVAIVTGGNGEYKGIPVIMKSRADNPSFGH